MTDPTHAVTETHEHGRASGSVTEVVTLFGGPAAHIAMLRDEIVTRRG